MSALSCPAPLRLKDRILMGHGSGGTLSAQLMRDIFLPAFSNPILDCLDDQAVVGISGVRVTMRTVFGTTRVVDMLAGDQLPRIC